MVLNKGVTGYCVEARKLKEEAVKIICSAPINICNCHCSATTQQIFVTGAFSQALLPEFPHRIRFYCFTTLPSALTMCWPSQLTYNI
ncbi:hypothetical protein XELAEV_18040029mg [Xenopus laevis]|uniref:Uncharacterized protein n=1 Tax=Xenopus laevis TaxID=8355 RepID=A0A974C8T4_XENLA|nr:hypothetical protein XELAEV_18040029mg [Xenopus laevis]